MNKGVVYNFTGFRVSGVVLRKVPEDAGVFLIEAVWQKFRDVQPHHGNSLAVVDVQVWLAYSLFSITLS